MTPFALENGAYRAEWDVFEVAVFVDLAQAVMGIIETPTNLNNQAADAMRRKLFPKISTDDAVAAEFQRLAGPQVVDAKIASLQLFIEKLLAVKFSDDNAPDKGTNVELVVPVADAKAVLQALTTMRVFLGEKLKIKTDQDTELLYDVIAAAATGGPSAEGRSGGANSQAEEQAFWASAYFAAGFVQESLIEALTGR